MDQLKEKRRHLETRLAELDAKALRRQLRAEEEKRKRDLRRKILIGTAILDLVERGVWHEADLAEVMDGFLTKPTERELFGL